MKLLFVSIYPTNTIARYLYSSYVLKAYIDKELSGIAQLDTKVINFSISANVSKICSAILGNKPDFVGFSMYIWNIAKIKEIIYELKKNASEFKIILGGPEISESTISDLCREEIGDYYIVGEGEILLKELILNLTQKSNIELPYNIYFRRGNTFEVKENSNRYDLNLDDVPSVYLSNTIEDRLYQYQQAFLETQRGCRYKCSYCVYHKNLDRIKYFSIDRILKELEHLIVYKKVSAIRFLDAIFPTDLQRSKRIINFLIDLKQKQFTIPWIYWEFVYNLIDDEFLYLTSKLKTQENISNYKTLIPLDQPQLYTDLIKGYTVINCIGIQSFNEDSLKTINRLPATFEAFRKFICLINKHNLVLKIDVILGLPEETEETYLKGIEFLIDTIIESDTILNIHRLQILPGSKLEEKAEKLGLKYDKNHLVYETNSLEKDKLKELSEISGVVFRIVNSPLRRLLKLKRDKENSQYVEIIREVIEKCKARHSTIDLFTDNTVNEDYWSGKIFKDIETDFIIRCLEE